MDEHICRCMCELVDGESRQGENHVAVRFGDRPNTDVFLNGTRQRRCYEAFAGRGDGWAIRESDCPAGPPPMPCQCRGINRGICCEKVYGDVSIVQMVPR